MINRAEVDGNGNIVIQDSDNTQITINVNNPQEIRQFLIDFQSQLNQLPNEILQLMERQNPNNVEIEKGANVYLGLTFRIIGNGVNAISLTVTITNLTKENRYFNTPFFKLSVPFEGSADTFVLLDRTYDINFPKKLEYGEVVTEDYLLRPNSREIFDAVIAKDANATLKVIAGTTVGEVYYSNEYRVDKLLENYARVR